MSLLPPEATADSTRSTYRLPTALRSMLLPSLSTMLITERAQIAPLPEMNREPSFTRADFRYKSPVWLTVMAPTPVDLTVSASTRVLSVALPTTSTVRSSAM